MKKSWYRVAEQVSRWVEAKTLGLLLFIVWPTISVCRDLATALRLDGCNGDSQRRQIVRWFPIEMQTKSKRWQQLTAVTSRKYPVKQQQAIGGVYWIELEDMQHLFVCLRATDSSSSGLSQLLSRILPFIAQFVFRVFFWLYGILIAAHKSVSVALPFRLLFVQRATCNVLCPNPGSVANWMPQLPHFLQRLDSRYGCQGEL